jgi:uncharacterized protein (DUF58 family)
MADAQPPPLPSRAQPPPLPRRPVIPLQKSVPSRPPPSNLLKPEELDRFKSLLVFARTTVDGFFAGKHKSNDYGASGEFAEFKQYSHGESVQDIDWRVYARSRDLVIRSYKEETDMVVHLVVDMSSSMRYVGAGMEGKFLRSARIAAALAYLMIHQGDKVSLTLFSDRLQCFLPPSGTRKQLYEITRELESRIARHQGTTEISASLQQCGALFNKRGRIVIISDFLGDMEKTFDALGQFVHRKFDILLLQVIDPDELDLPNVSIARFVDMETGEEVQVEPDAIRKAYKRNMDAIIDYIETRALRNRIHHSILKTKHPYLNAIEAYLGFRTHKS